MRKPQLRSRAPERRRLALDEARLRPEPATRRSETFGKAKLCSQGNTEIVTPSACIFYLISEQGPQCRGRVKSSSLLSHPLSLPCARGTSAYDPGPGRAADRDCMEAMRGGKGVE